MSVKRTISWLFGLPVAVLLICFAVANRDMITVSLDPISRDDPWLSFAMPAFGLFFAGIFCGLVVGGVIVWLRQGRWRKAARKAMVPREQPSSQERGLVQLQ